MQIDHYDSIIVDNLYIDVYMCEVVVYTSVAGTRCGTTAGIGEVEYGNSICSG